MRKNVFLIIFTIYLSGYTAWADITKPSSSPNSVGSGAMAIGMGGAYIGRADDATAASWNPAGLVQIRRSQISLVGDFSYREENNSFGDTPISDGVQSVSKSNLNYFSVTFPIFEKNPNKNGFFNKNMALSMNYQRLYDYNREWNFPVNISDGPYQQQGNVEYKRIGSLSAFGVACAIDVIDEPIFNIPFGTLSFGFTMNFWDNDPFNSKWNENFHTSYSSQIKGPMPIPITKTEDFYRTDTYSFTGINFNIGLLWIPFNRKLSIGAVLKSPFTADIIHEQTIRNRTIFGQNEPIEDTQTFTQNSELDMPMSYGIGVAYRFTDNLTVSGDIYRTEWQDYIMRKQDGSEESPITEKPVSESDIDPTYQVRFGAEYLLIYPESHLAIPLRCGIFYDPAPAKGNPDDFYGITLGSGFIFHNKNDAAIKGYAFDIAFQYRFGRDVGDSILPDNDFSQDIDEFNVYSSVMIKF